VLGLTGPSVGFEITPSEGEVLKPLFVDLANRRALLRSPIGRPVEHAAHVQASVEQIRGQLVETRKLLRGGGDAAEWIDSMDRRMQGLPRRCGDIRCADRGGT
jgi:hypothetical protein